MAATTFVDYFLEYPSVINNKLPMRCNAAAATPDTLNPHSHPLVKRENRDGKKFFHALSNCQRFLV